MGMFQPRPLPNPDDLVNEQLQQALGQRVTKTPNAQTAGPGPTFQPAGGGPWTPPAPPQTPTTPYPPSPPTDSLTSGVQPTLRRWFKPDAPITNPADAGTGLGQRPGQTIGKALPGAGVTGTPGPLHTPTTAGTAPSPEEAAGGLPAAPAGGNWQSWFQQQTAGLPPTTASLQRIVDGLKAGGHTVEWATHAGGQQSDDKIIIDGQMYDLIRDVGGAGAGWQLSLDAAGGASRGGGTGGGGSTGTGGVYDDQISEAIKRLLERGFSPVSETDPGIQGQFAPISRTLQRGATRSAEAAAEQMAFQGANVGGAGGALDAERNKINEGLAGQEGLIMSQLIGDELKARRQDVVAALGVAQGQERIALQLQLSKMDDEIRRLQLSQQNQQFYDAPVINA